MVNLDNEKVSFSEKNLNVLDSKKENRGSFLNKILNYFSRDSVGIKLIFVLGVIALFLGFWEMSSGIKNSFVVSPIQLEDRAGRIEFLNMVKLMNSEEFKNQALDNSEAVCVNEDCDILAMTEELTESENPNLLEEADSEKNIIFEGDFFNELKPDLLKAGYPEEVIDSLQGKSMEEVVLILDEFNEQFNELSQDQLENLSPAEIRELLIEFGANEDELKSVSDQELVEMYNQALKEAKKEIN